MKYIVYQGRSGDFLYYLLHEGETYRVPPEGLAIWIFRDGFQIDTCIGDLVEELSDEREARILTGRLNRSLSVVNS